MYCEIPECKLFNTTYIIKISKKEVIKIMQFAIAEKSHEKYLEDVVREVSQDSVWCKKLLAAKYNERFLITFKQLEEVPCSLWTDFSRYGLEFFVSKVDSCPEQFAAGATIFKFEAKGFSHVVSYSSNK